MAAADVFLPRISAAFCTIFAVSWTPSSPSVRVIEGAGHAIAIEKADAVSALLQRNAGLMAG